MGLVSFDEARASLVCPVCRAAFGTDSVLKCTGCGRAFDVIETSTGRWPVMVDFDQSVLQVDDIAETAGASLVQRRGPGAIMGRVRGLTTPYNKTAEQFLARLRADTRSLRPHPRILVIGGGEVGNGIGELYADDRVAVYAFDIYASPVVQLIADAHQLPWPDGYFDGVVIQAVLEHVLDPQQVVAELDRVLVAGGYVYSDVPFMQQVHEGAYDFTRFTDSGHRWLYRRFAVEDSGAVAGAGTTLLWSIDYFARAVTGKKAAGRAARLLFFWLAYFDRLIKPGRDIDGANSLFLYARKTETSIRPQDVIAYYQGAGGP